MTDKQIIIDGVDVSGCTRYCSDTGKCTAFKSQYLCSERNNCYTKRILKKNKTINILKEKLLCKEQECEELKGRLKYIREENKYLKESATDEQIDFVALNNHIKALEFQLDQLKEELQEYQDWFDEFKLMFRYDDREPDDNSELYSCLESVVDENKKLKQTIAEIKDIAEIEIECKTYEIENDCFNETRCKALNEHIDFTKQILQKISECEVENE